METAVHSGRRDERVPLDALIELRSDESAEVLEADGLDLSPGGLAMRAAFVPPVGAKLKCHFRCSPEGERVRAEGEVVWAQWESDRDGAFGMRFLALDTKSATAIRRHMELEPQLEPEVELPRVANMRIDGVGAAIETDVLFADAGSIVLEQELNFLKLGRGVSIDVPGRGERRGRIGSVELRHGPLDVPTLVFGILLDGEAEAREVETRGSAREHNVAVAAKLMRPSAPAPGAAREQPYEHAPELSTHEPVAARISVSAPVFREPDLFAPVTAKVDEAHERGSVSRADTRSEPVNAAVAGAAESAESDELEFPRSPSALDHLGALGKSCLAWLSLMWSRFVPNVGALLGSFRGQTAQLREAHWPEAKSKLAVFFARARLLVSAQKDRFAQLRQQRQAKPRATAQAPRVQRSSAAAPRAGETPQKAAKGNGSRWLAIGLAVAGIALGVYALAPRSGADRIRVRRVAENEPSQAAPAPALAAEPSLVPTVAAEPSLEAAAALDPAAAPGQPTTLTFGEASVPNGRMFSLRMSGPVESVEGESREDGFTVRVPGRLALDRASPIATSHRAVARAMILNRGDYAELTVDFLPGLRPKYQVVGKDAAIEVTLERL